MRGIREGEAPFDGGTALQEDPDRPAFRGSGPDDYACVGCGNVLAASMNPEQITKKVGVKCGRSLPDRQRQRDRRLGAAAALRVRRA